MDTPKDGFVCKMEEVFIKKKKQNGRADILPIPNFLTGFSFEFGQREKPR